MNFRRKRRQVREFVLGHHVADPSLHQIKRSELSVKIADDFVGRPYILAQQPHERFVDFARLHQFHDGNLEAFLEHFAGFRRTNFAADIGSMRGRSGEADEFTVMENRFADTDVRQMASTHPNIVGYQDVARLKLIGRIDVEKMFNGRRQGCNERRDTVRRLDERASGCIGDHAREVVAIAHNGRKRRTHQRRCRFVDRRNQTGPKHLKGDGIERCVGTIGCFVRHALALLRKIDDQI